MSNIRFLVAACLLCSFGAAVARAQQPASSRYLAVVQRTCDTLLSSGVDNYGEQKSGMILSVLDRATGKPLATLPPAPYGVRQHDRTGPGGSNANLQQDLYRTLNELSRLTGNPRYAQASDKAIADFLRITQSPETGLLAWGEHLYWNCVEDRLGDLDPNQTHEPTRSFVTFERAYQLDPTRVIAYARGLWDHQVADQATGAFARHAKYHKHDPRFDFDFEKEASYFIDTWSRAYAHTKDPVFDGAVRVIAQRYIKSDRMNKRNLLDCDTSGRPERVNKCVPLWMVSMAMECHDAATRVTPPTAEVLKESARRHDAGFLGLDHAPADPARGFVFFAFTDSGRPRPDKDKQTNGYSRAWSMGYGVNTTAMFVPLLYTRQAQLGQSYEGEPYRQLILQAADLYKTARPAADQDIWAGEYGLAIFTELAAYRLTGEFAYLNVARELGDLAIAALWDDAPLPRASSKTTYYDVISYADTTMLSLLALHEAVSGLEMKVPISDITR